MLRKLTKPVAKSLEEDINMKMCNAEIIKKIKELESKKLEIRDFENRNKSTSYAAGESKIYTNYNFRAAREEVSDVDWEIRRLKHLLAVANASVIVPKFDMTIGECLVFMAQLNSEKLILEGMSRKDPKSRHTTFNSIEFTELNYDINECKQELQDITNTIKELQIAIDRVNLTHEIDV
jgi:hypothetical protein